MLNYLLNTMNAVIAIPVLVLLIQVLNSLRNNKPAQVTAAPLDLSTVILVPAHNEESVIEKTLLSLKDQVTEKDRIIVIADNCTDDTEIVARRLGVEVVIRENMTELGKGYALGFGIEHINKSNSNPDALVIIDADCTVTRGSIKDLAATSVKLNRPVQGLYLMHSNAHKGIGQKVAEFAWMVKNKVRPAGYKKMGLPCLLQGSGMAFPWCIVDVVKFKSGNIVEDLELGIQYTLNGFPPFFYPEVIVSSYFPSDSEGEKSQRKRWEHGHLVTSVKLFPELIKKSIKVSDINSAALAADLLVPPLALLAILLFIINTFCLWYGLVVGDIFPLLISMALLVVFCVEIIMAWYYFAREIISLKQLLYVPVYIVNKIPLYFMLMLKRQVQWVKTSRKNQDDH